VRVPLTLTLNATHPASTLQEEEITPDGTIIHNLSPPEIAFGILPEDEEEAPIADLRDVEGITLHNKVRAHRLPLALNTEAPLGRRYYDRPLPTPPPPPPPPPLSAISVSIVFHTIILCHIGYGNYCVNTAY
jgi:hypothetical protein